MNFSNKVIELLKMPETKIHINGSSVSFEAFEIPFLGDKRLVVTAEDFDINSTDWNIEYTQDCEIIEVSEEDRVIIEEWIVKYYESVTGIKIN